jgi:hypothetical protein
MKEGAKQPGLAGVREGLNAFLSGLAPGRLLDLLAFLDAGRAVGMVRDHAQPCRRLGQSVLQSVRDGDAPAAPSSELAAACEAFVRRHGWEGPRRTDLGHIGWADVVCDLSSLRHLYGFTSSRSIATFEELLQWVSAACGSLTRVLLACGELVVALRQTARAPERPEWDALAQLISQEVALWTKTREVVDRTSHVVREVLTRTEDFKAQRQALAAQAGAEPDESVGRLLIAIAKVLSPRAWLVKSPEAQLTCLEPVADYRLRLGFADGLFREVELGLDYWSTTGLEIDPETFRSARIDRVHNRLVWSNGFTDSGERLHLAIIEDRLGGRAIGPIGAYEIVPGRSIGPFELGMTRQQIEEGLTVRPMRRFSQGSAFFPLIEVSEAELARWHDYPLCGVTVSYDVSGRCCKLNAVFSWSVEPPIFTLLGQVVNGMSLETTMTLLRTIASDVRGGYGSVDSDAAGVGANVHEASDEKIMSVTVRPPENRE